MPATSVSGRIRRPSTRRSSSRNPVTRSISNRSSIAPAPASTERRAPPACRSHSRVTEARGPDRAAPWRHLVSEQSLCGQPLPQSAPFHLQPSATTSIGLAPRIGFRNNILDNRQSTAAGRDKVRLHDLHATMPRLPCPDHERLNCPHAGLDFRLTDLFRNVKKSLIPSAKATPAIATA